MTVGVVNEVRRGFYLDSVALMRLSASIGALPGVDEAVLMIGTEANKDIMREAGLLADAGAAAGPGDLVIALRAADATAADAALAAAREALERRPAARGGAAWRPRTLAGALAQMPDANLALVSTPGAFAAREARAALARDLDVMIFSDNVGLDEERALKEDAAQRGRLLMGPDCGTAYLNGTPLGFANAVARGPVGVVAASGTGLQEVSVLLTRAGSGISHGIGVGGRDLSDAVGGLGALAALERLARDEATRHVVLISKPPGPRTAERLFAHLAGLGKPVTACVLGLATREAPAGVTLVPTLKAAAAAAAGRALPTGTFDAAALAAGATAGLAGERSRLHGLFCGGTLCTEAQVVLRAGGVAVASNAPLDGSADADAPHSILDLGADEFTLGRPHPMIEPDARLPHLHAALADPAAAVVLLDLVLGYGAHPDPAAGVAAAVTAAGDDRPVVVASVCGTAQDPQREPAQTHALEAAGVLVAPSNADAAALALEILRARR
jgi:FdrA protein